MFVLMTLAAGPAQACGGLFCNQATLGPVVQNAERIVFEIGEGTVDTHVQVFYEGPADEFAWIVPVPAVPELFISQTAMFDVLSSSTAPVFQLDRVTEGRCSSGDIPIGCGSELALFAGDAAPRSASSDGGGTLGIISQEQVGPYDTVVLRASDETTLLNYLQASGYDLPDTLASVLAPYVGGDSHFVALKLSKDSDVGDIEPLGMRYSGDEAMIPIQLTAVAAADDMPLEVYVFAEQRAVPQSYLHVEINEAAIDWAQGGQNYYEVVGQAADEAGGHAFVTDFYGPARTVAPDYDVDLEELRAMRFPVDWLQSIVNQIGVPDAFTAGILADILGAPDDVDPLTFINCPWCFDYDTGSFDANAATDRFEEEVLRALEAMAEMFDDRMLTRMTSSLDAAEMTVDPVFVLNRDLSGEDAYVPVTRTAALVLECHAGRNRQTASRRLDLPDGRSLSLLSFDELGFDRTDFDVLVDQRSMAAKRVSQLGRTGTGEVLVDLTEDLSDLARIHNRGSQFGCATGRGVGWAAAWLALLGVIARRRRA